jgi:hypothetical protein
MLDRLDAHQGEVARLGPADYRRIVDLCPYTPPHRWDLGFPRLMLRAKAARARAEGVSREDRWLGNVGALGTAASVVAPLANWRTASSRDLG